MTKSNPRINVGDGYSVGGSGIRKTVHVGHTGVNVGKSGTKIWVPGIGSLWLSNNKRSNGTKFLIGNRSETKGITFGWGWAIFLTIITGGWFLVLMLGLGALTWLMDRKILRWVLLVFIVIGVLSPKHNDGVNNDFMTHQGYVNCRMPDSYVGPADSTRTCTRDGGTVVGPYDPNKWN